MATRKPATTAEIVRVLEGHPALKKGPRALPYETALAYIRTELNTNRRNATEWLKSATAAVPPEVELIATVSGRILYVGRGGDDLYLGSVGGYVDSDDESYWPELMEDGTAVSRDGDAGVAEFVVLSKHLRAMCQRAAQHRAKAVSAGQRTKELARTGAEERYGQALSHLRGLIVAAGLDPERVLDAAYRIGVTGESTQVLLSLKDSEITALGNALAAYEIEPVPLN